MDAFERPLALQLWAVQRTAAACLGKAADPKQTDEQVDGHINRSTKLLRAYSTMMEALDRHRGKAPPQVVVGNVNVNSGGQAIVGSVECPDPGKIPRDGEKKRLQ